MGFARLALRHCLSSARIVGFTPNVVPCIALLCRLFNKFDATADAERSLRLLSDLGRLFPRAEDLHYSILAELSSKNSQSRM